MNSPRFLGFLRFAFVFVNAIAVAGCLSADRKEIILTVRPDSSGSARIVFHNLVSVDERSHDASIGDYEELVRRYLKGSKFEDYSPLFLNFKKRLFEENGVLNGEVTFEFSHYEDVGLYRYNGRGPWMYHVGFHSDLVTEHFDTSNGSLGGELMPVVFWPEDAREFRIVSHFDRGDGQVRPLLPLFKRIGTD